MDNKPKEIMFAYNNINNVFDAVKRAADRIGVKVLSEDISTFTIVLESKGGLFSKGEQITITLEKVKDLQTKIYFDDPSKKGTITTKNDTIEKIKLIVDELLPKVKMPEESNNEPVNNVNSQVPDYTIGNNIQQAVYSNQQMDNYNNQVPDYQNQQGMIPDVQNQEMYQNPNMASYNNYQQMLIDPQYNNQVPDYQNQQGMIPNVQSQEMYQDPNMTSYNNYQQMPMEPQYNNQIPGYQNQQGMIPDVQNQEMVQQPMVDSNQASDPVNELMMGKFGGSEPKAINTSQAQSSAKQNSDPLLDFMSNMNV